MSYMRTEDSPVQTACGSEVRRLSVQTGVCQADKKTAGACAYELGGTCTYAACQAWLQEQRRLSAVTSHQPVQMRLSL